MAELPVAGETSEPFSIPPPPATEKKEEETEQSPSRAEGVLVRPSIRYSPGGTRPEAEGTASDPDPGEEKADPEQFLKPPNGTAVSEKNVETPQTVRKRSHKSPSVRKSSFGPSPKRLSPWKSSPKRDHASSSFNLSPRDLSTPQAKRRSWSRLSLKGTKCRKSLPPVHRDVTELSKSISLDLPETERLAALLLASFQFSARKLEHSLKQSDGFSPEAFKVQVDSVSQDLKHFVQKLNRDGTLKNCVDNPNGVLLDSALEESVAQVKEHITRFSTECHAWDQLLLQHQQSAEEMSRQLEESRRNGGQAEPSDYLQTSQAEVLRSKPNYQQILDEQREVLSCMELVLDELQQAVKLLQAFGEDSRRYLQRLSERLATRTFRQLENSPVRKLIAGPPRKIPPPAEG